MGGARAVPNRGASVKAANDERQLVDDCVRDAVAVGNVIKRRILVESPHVDGPLDDFTVATNRKSLAVADNGKRRQVNIRR
jgi:hypothetical protein